MIKRRQNLAIICCYFTVLLTDFSQRETESDQPLETHSQSLTQLLAGRPTSL